ncbi:MAG: hypothetical protein GXP05_06790 [Alphaproteobacteria bacterium]|nr:hypothetical protein [Alphaproteobacteria bacterium]
MRGLILTGALLAGTVPASGAPVCVVNFTDQDLLLMVDDLAGQRRVRLVTSGEELCLSASDAVNKAVVGVFASEDAIEGCSRLTRPGQVETLLDFMEFDNCRWADTDRNIP